MTKKSMSAFLKNEIKNIKIRDCKNNKLFSFLISIYLLFAISLILSNSLKLFTLGPSADSVRGILAQFQIIILFYLTLNFGVKGFTAALILNIFSFSSIAANMIIEKTILYLPGVIAYTTVLIIMYFIYNYQQEINLKVEELTKEKKKLKYMAYYDNLTEIANREMIIERLDYLSSMSESESINYKLIFIDFKNFKKINESWGYEIGDFILQEIAARLHKNINENDLTGRLGGDEFAVVVQRELSQKELKRYIRKIKRELEKPYKYENREIILSSNFGISSFPEDGKNSKEIIRSADIAMYKAKNSMENEIEYFAKNMEKDVVAGVQMEDSLKKAIQNEEFHLLFQPQYKTDGKKLRGFEALIRWHSPELGTISPVRFIPVAEQTGLIKKIGNWVIKTAIYKFKNMKTDFKDEPVLSINISVVQLTDPDFVDQVKDIITKERIDGFKLEFEITESLFISDQEYVIDVLYKLKELGISIAMDDFGTGYASLSYLQHIPLDVLKIDKAFIDLISYKADHEKMMVPPIIEMAHQWGIKVVAEGVETVEQLHYLEDHNCDYLQGFLLNKPLSEFQITRVF
ncbi:diguanylate cyclase (GGDEF)-like protein [Halanaerobium saccharolyticum]|uniref:Diguanylate cyclase (GGDEF)-like protein n=1 Tax=Halanaerobium saccharolyticum TaxID=43595 RepID=A0A4R7Z578_9FIRM|nr:GGDEF domain-containing phosphodiesterase [Halanaerobium saccharolyticum]RAK09334.1 diguanylate cyclase (GGDEF)-like protein [Halanaerobium saccharolyticum]TDW06193.1 diguanylate cyclase (GGDEF)-like protein [Halanaerobium saccharolyticum]TDX60987.1 diguanylate cyclase (GGDEF)-like protein [Halanaerobium saccharolyticum]